MGKANSSLNIYQNGSRKVRKVLDKKLLNNLKKAIVIQKVDSIFATPKREKGTIEFFNR